MRASVIRARRCREWAAVKSQLHCRRIRSENKQQSTLQLQLLPCWLQMGLQTQENGKYCGVVHLHDLIKEGII